MPAPLRSKLSRRRPRRPRRRSCPRWTDRSSARCVSGCVLAAAVWSTSPCRSWLCAAPMAKRPSAALRSMGQARTAGARGRRCRCAASWSWPPSPKPVEDALEPLALLLGRLAPDRARRHVADELALFLAQALIALLAPQRDLVPGRRAVDVGEVRRPVVLVLGRAQAGVIAGVVELPHLSFG